MKKMLFLTMAAAGLASFAMTDAEFNAAYQRIRNDKRNQPRYQRYIHAQIIGDLNDFGRTNELTYAQRVRLAEKVAEHANVNDELRPVFEKAIGEIRGCTNAPLRTATLNALFDAMLHTYSFNRARGVPEAEKILAELEEVNDVRRTINMRVSLAKVALSVTQSRAKANFDREYELVRAVKPDEKAKQPVRLQLQNAVAAGLGAMLSELISVDPSGAEALFARDAEFLNDAAKNTYRGALADYATKMKDRPLFDRVLKGVRADPKENRRGGIYRKLMASLHRFDPETAAAIVDGELASPALKPEERAVLLAIRQSFDDPPIFNYGFNNPGQYGRWRKALLARKALAEANPTNKACAYFTSTGSVGYETERMIWYDDLATAKPIVAAALAKWPYDRKFYEQTAQIRAIEGDAKGAADALAQSLGLKGTKAAQSNQVLRVVAFLTGRGLADFDRVNAPLKLSDAERLKALRETSKTLFTYRRDADCRAIYDEIVGKMYRPEVRKTLTAKYVKHAPQSAGAFAFSPLYADWSNYETRFAPYGGGYGESGETDAKHHLKSAVVPACDPDWKTGFAVLYDDEGVHVYVRCDDPAIAEVNDGKRDAGNLEMLFAPGGLEVPYHSIFFTGLPACDDPHAADWCSPGRHYRRNVDAYAKDAALTPEGVVAHVSLPWISFYDSLPIGGNLWNLGVIRSCKSGMQTSGGIVHELSRGVQIRFDLTPAQLTALKRKVSVIAYNRYRKIREDAGGFIQRWNDGPLGDTEFYAAVVGPLVERLDKAGAELTAPCADGEIERFFVEFVPKWAEIGYEIDELRTRYLNDRLFEDEK